MNAIEIRGLHKSFRDFTLSDLTLTLPAGCIMGLVGENGAGKSTTIKLLLGLLRPDGGTVTLLGRDAATHLRDIKEDIGVVTDEVGIPSCLTPRQVGRVMRHTFRNWSDAAYADYLRRFSLPEHKCFKDFSRGMRMKLGIAVALSHDPKLLILDEATSGLDPVVRDEILDIFMDFTRDESHSILLSSHIVSDLEKACDYIAFLRRGRLLLCEEKDALRERYGLLHATEAEMVALPAAAIVGRKTTPYGVEAIVRRDAVPRGTTLAPVELEQLFILMSKEAQTP